jgi:putative endopeptidase
MLYVPPMKSPRFALVLAVAGCGGAATETAKPAAPAAPAPGIDEASLDRSVSPCDDFFQFACGGWLKRTEIPADRSSWGRFQEIDERNEKLLKEVLDGAAAGKKAAFPQGDKVGDYYAACMAEEEIEKSAPGDLKKLLERIDAIKDVPGMAKEIAHLHLGVANPLFQARSQQDAADATQVILGVDQGGIGLPDRDYYTEARFEKERAGYQAHVAKMLELAGIRGDAKTILRIETGLATASMKRVDRRDPHKIYHRIELKGLVEKAPKFPWAAYLGELGHPGITQINVAVPEFAQAVSQMVDQVPMADWKLYLKWHAIHGLASQLSKPFVDENFRFFGQTLNGVKELEPRWKRCLHATDAALGEALAQPFIARTFGDDGKKETQQMIVAVEQAMGQNLAGLSWMDDPTRAQAKGKLGEIANMVGFPDKWRNYDSLKIVRSSHVMNFIAANEFETHRDLGKIGKPVDRGEWQMTPPTVNAYYEPALNEMVFPAGILQPPFFDRAAPAAVNYGAIGMVMGHELTHGFDDEGRQYDGKGNLRDWWSKSVNAEFEKRAACVAEQFSGYVPIDDLHLDGKLTLGENIADLGGLKMAHAAFQATHPGRADAKAGAFSDEQLFFLGYAQSWCAKRRPENEKMRVTTDPHSPPRFRVVGPLSNLPEFGSAFQCKPGDKMVRPQQCVVW